MISLADTWANPEEQNLLETGLKRAAGAITLGDVWPRPMVQYQKDPVGFFVDILRFEEWMLRWSLLPEYKTHTWDGTEDPLVAILEGLAANEDVGVQSGTGTGKSVLLGGIYLWFIACWENARVFTLAPKADQLALYSWMELDRLKMWDNFKRHFPMAVKTTLQIQMIPRSKQWGVWGYPVQMRSGQSLPQAAKGQHGKDQLLVYEEGPGIEWPVYKAGAATSTGEHNRRLGVGNPDHTQDPLALFCEASRVRRVIMSAYDHPNVVTGREVIGGACTRVSIANAIEDYDGEDTPLFKAQVRGIAPEEAQHSLIKARWVREAFARYEDEDQRRLLELGGVPAIGADVANNTGGDKAAWCHGIGAVCHEIQDFPVGDGHDIRDSNQLGARIAVLAGLLGCAQEQIAVDPAAVGAGAVNKLRELDFWVPDLNASRKPIAQVDEDLLQARDRMIRDVARYVNFRAQAHWQARLDLQFGRVAIAPDEDLLKDLVLVLWEPRGGKIKVEDKLELRKRLGRSPNKGDAWILWNWIRQRRPIVQEEKLRAWDPEVLAHEARESRRVRTPVAPLRPQHIDPMLVEVLD